LHPSLLPVMNADEGPAHRHFIESIYSFYGFLKGLKRGFLYESIMKVKRVVYIFEPPFGVVQKYKLLFR
jgi:hypothetical protein